MLVTPLQLLIIKNNSMNLYRVNDTSHFSRRTLFTLVDPLILPKIITRDKLNLRERSESSVFPFTESESEITPNTVNATFSNGDEIPIKVPTERFIKKLVKKYKKQEHINSDNAFYLFLLTLQNKIEHDHNYKELRSQFMKEIALVASITWRNCPIYYKQAFVRLASRISSSNDTNVNFSFAI
ncbi:3536_t:CDS:2 [Entrophospora sp. SA101]|nr:3536_t:CDS:2 [Entrophospora sp. SA101]CAJ0925288.1 3280_t:CDS:2 [Entrophospora sp. SA101]